MHPAERLIRENLKTKNPHLDLGKCILRGDEPCLQLLTQCTHLETLILSDWWYEFNEETNEWIEYKSKNDYKLNHLRYIPTFLPQLKKIIAFNNIIVDITSIKELKQLTYLDVGCNRITNINDLLDLPNLQKLYLYGNPVQNIPQELLGKNATDNCLERIKPYLEEIRDSSYVFEGKMVLIGEPAAGKTTLCEKILNAQYKLKHTESMTRGIAVSEWIFPYTNPKQTPVHEDFDRQFKAHIFDFGGQEIMHATHRYFFSRRTLYVLVVDTRPEDTDFHYWLSMIELFGENSPVVIVMNDKHDKHKEVPSNILAQFEHLVGKQIFHVNLRNNQGLSDLVSCLQDELQRLPHVGEEKLPKSWVKIRTELNKFWLPNSLTKKHKKKSYLSHEEFLKTCQSCDLTKESKAISVARTLHVLGSVLYFHENMHLQNFIILDKHWATEAVYLALLDTEVAKKIGKFNYQDLQRIWQGKYKPDTHGALVELMLNFKIIYRVRNTQDTYIAPLLLKENPSEQVASLFPAQATYTRFEYHYIKFMPKGLMARLIIEENKQIHQDLQWRTGVVLELNGCLVEATEHRYGTTNKIAFRIQGNEAGKALAIIFKLFNEIHGEFPNLEFEEMIPCHCSECRRDEKPHFFKYFYLRKAKTKLKTVNCEKSLEDINILTLLEGYEHHARSWEEILDRGAFTDFFTAENESRMKGNDKALFNQLRSEFIFGNYGFDFVQRAKVLMKGYV